MMHYDYLITKGILGKDENFKDFVNTNSKVNTQSFLTKYPPQVIIIITVFIKCQIAKGYKALKKKENKTVHEVRLIISHQI